MFEPGKVYKVKIEVAPGATSFGRATILERSGSNLMVQLRTSKSENEVLKMGTKIWFVNDEAVGAFNGLWTSSVVGTQHAGRKNVMLCAKPRLEPVEQRRRMPRVELDVPAELKKQDGTAFGGIRTKDLSRSGIALVTPPSLSEQLDSGDVIDLEIDTSIGKISLPSRVIRTDKNWLVNKTLIGLEFVQPSGEAVEQLDKLLVMLGGKPRNSNSDAGATQVEPKKRNLSTWLNPEQNSVPNKSRFIGNSKKETEGDTDDAD